MPYGYWDENGNYIDQAPDTPAPPYAAQMSGGLGPGSFSSPIQAPPAPSTPPPRPAAPVVQNGMINPVQGGGYSGAKDFGAIVNYWMDHHPATAPDMPGLIALLGQQGIYASQATHAGGLPSDDKLNYNGQEWDLGTSLGSPSGAWFRNFSGVTPGSGGGAVDTSGLLNSSVLAPFTEQGPQITVPTPFNYDPYKPTTAADIFADPSYDFRFNQGERGVAQDRAARGLSKTGGTLKALTRYGQDFGSQEFANVDARRYRDYTTDYTQKRDAYDLNVVNPNNTLYSRQLSDFLNRRDTYYKNQANAFDRPYQVAQLGYNAAAA